MRRLLPVVLLAVFALPAGADAARNPNEAQRAAIAERAETPAVCLTIKVSTKRKGWAAYTFRDRRSTRKQCVMHASNGLTVLQRNGKTWRQRWAGSDCPRRAPKRVPAAVWRDLSRGHCR